MAHRPVYFVSLGCPKNRVDTEVMLGMVAEDGGQIVGRPEDAEVIVVNTCGFIGEAKQESVDTILDMARFKEAGLCRRLVVTGCLSQRYAGELQRELPEVDVFLGSSDMHRIAQAISGQERGVQVDGALRWLYDDTTPRRASTSSHTAYMKIAEGCDRPCGFCIIPQLRGAQRSRDPASLERELQALAASGAVEVNLVAQDLTAYGSDLTALAGSGGAAVDLAGLLRRLAQVATHHSGLRWLRLHYAYPTATTDALLDVVAAEARIAKYIDVPLQHIDDDMLKLMRRGHVGKTARQLVERIRARVPGVTLRTTFIVGHPGEREERFRRLFDFVAEAEFDRVGVFTYSNEEGTHAATLTELAVPAKEAEARRRELMRLQRRISKRKMKSLVGRELEVLVDGPSDESEYLYEGRHQGQAPEIDGKVFLALDADVPALAPGTLVQARIDSFADYDLAATVTAVLRRPQAVRGRSRLPIIVA